MMTLVLAWDPWRHDESMSTTNVRVLATAPGPSLTATPPTDVTANHTHIFCTWGGVVFSQVRQEAVQLQVQYVNDHTYRTSPQGTRMRQDVQFRNFTYNVQVMEKCRLVTVVQQLEGGILEHLRYSRLRLEAKFHNTSSPCDSVHPTLCWTLQPLSHNTSLDPLPDPCEGKEEDERCLSTDLVLDLPERNLTAGIYAVRLTTSLPPTALTLRTRLCTGGIVRVVALPPTLTITGGSPRTQFYGVPLLLEA